MKLNDKIPALLTGISSLFIVAATTLLILGKDITPLVGLIPVLVTNLILLARVDKVEKNTNGTMAALVEAALRNKDNGSK